MQTSPLADRSKRSGIRQFFADYFWFIFKNVIGWLLILASPVLGAAVPGPGGIPVFLIGFAMVTFPGKRKLTSRVLRGKPMRVQTILFTGLTAAISLIVPGLALWYAVARWGDLFQSWKLGGAVIVGIVVLAFLSTWLATRLGLWVVNLVLLNLPRLRRRIRPWLRRQGINLLPPRRRQLPGAAPTGAEDEILEIDERHHRRLRTFLTGFGQWAYRAVSLGITIAIFVWILRPVARHWHVLDDAILSISPIRFLVAAAMLSTYLLVFRALTWRRVLGKFDRSLPLAAATRIWALTELARLLPGGIWQTAPRIRLIRAYHVEPVLSMTSHVIEFTIVFMANLLVGLGGVLLFFGQKVSQYNALFYLGLALLLPFSLLILRKTVFQRLLNRALRILNKPPVSVAVSSKFLVGLLLWDIAGLVWQAMAIWILLGQPELMGVSLSELYFIAAAYSLAWCIGKFAIWAPAGIGVRELAFVYIILASPLAFHVPLSEQITWVAHLALASILLRIWSVAGEILLAAVAYLVDRKDPAQLTRK